MVMLILLSEGNSDQDSSMQMMASHNLFSGVMMPPQPGLCQGQGPEGAPNQHKNVGQFCKILVKFW